MKYRFEGENALQAMFDVVCDQRHTWLRYQQGDAWIAESFGMGALKHALLTVGTQGIIGLTWYRPLSEHMMGLTWADGVALLNDLKRGAE